MLSLSSQEKALAPAGVHGIWYVGYSGASTRGDFGGYGWFGSSSVVPLSCGVFVGMVSVPESSIGLS